VVVVDPDPSTEATTVVDTAAGVVKAAATTPSSVRFTRRWSPV
jgi:hypothetical protein